MSFTSPDSAPAAAVTDGILQEDLRSRDTNDVTDRCCTGIYNHINKPIHRFTSHPLPTVDCNIHVRQHFCMKLLQYGAIRINLLLTALLETISSSDQSMRKKTFLVILNIAGILRHKSSRNCTAVSPIALSVSRATRRLVLLLSECIIAVIRRRLFLYIFPQRRLSVCRLSVTFVPPC